MCKKLLFLILFIVLLSATTIVSAAITVTTADGNGADTYLSNDSQGGQGPDAPHGTETEIIGFRQLAATRSKAAYIRFDISVVGGDMNDAIFSFEVAGYNKGGGTTSQIYGLIDGPNDILWDEATTSYNNAYGVVPNPPTGLGDCVVDLTDMVLVGTITTLPNGTYDVFSSEPNALLDNFLKADTNKRVTFLFVGSGNDETVVASKENTGDILIPTLTLPHAFGIYASNPNPADLSTSVSLATNLSWTPGVYAETHDVYLGTDFNDVNDATRDVHPNVLFEQDYDPNTYDPGTLQVSTTYYWRIDEISNGGSPIYKGDVWSFTTAATQASQPSPYNGEICVFSDPCTVFSWRAGGQAAQSKLYLGISPGPLTLETTINHTDAQVYSYQKTGLAKDTDYVWRVDEVNGATTWTGDIWTFKTLPDLPIIGSGLVGWWPCDCPGKAIDWSGYNQHGTVYGTTSVPGYVDSAVSFDGGTDYISLPIAATISTLDSATIATWVNWSGTGANWQRIFDFGSSSSTGYMFMTPRSGDAGTNNALRFAITLTDWQGGAESIIDAPESLPTGWHHVAISLDGNASEMTLYLDAVPVATEATLVLPSDLNSTVQSWLGRSQYTADPYFNGMLDDLRIYDYAMAQEQIKLVMAPKEAWLPDPPDGATGVYQNPTLSWEPGKYAASANGHNLYYSTNFADVNTRTVTPIILTDPTYTIPTPPSPLESLTTYYWVVDEVNGAETWLGNVWRFTIRDLTIIDDFESYTDTGLPRAPGMLRETWIDGYYQVTFPSSLPLDATDGKSGSFVQLANDPCDGTTNTASPALDGDQSMKFYYDNDGTITWLYDLYAYDPYYSYVAPMYSEAIAAIVDAGRLSSSHESRRLENENDFSGYKLLKVGYYGDPTNTVVASDKLYVTLRDADGTEVTVSNPDQTIIQKAGWENWYIKMSDFASNPSLDLANITRIYIGIGNKSSPVSGGRGVIFLDEIKLLSEGVCIPGTVLGDFTNDCRVDTNDLQRMTELWLGKTPTMPTPVINLDASGLALGTLNQWNNTGSAGGSFKDFNALVAGDNPTVAMVEGVKSVVFDGNDILVANFRAPSSITGNNPFTAIYKVWNLDIGVEEWILMWSKRGGPDGTYAGVGYGTSAGWGAVAHWGGPDMGFDRGVPAAHTWHTIGVSYQGGTDGLEYVLVDGVVNATETKTLDIYADCNMTVGAAYDGNSNDPNFVLVPLFNLSGAVASVKLYDTYIPPGDLAILLDTPIDMKQDDVIDFKDIAVLATKWLVGPVLYE